MISTKSAGLAFTFVLLLAGGAFAQPTGCTPVAPGILDPTFETGEPWPAWTVQSSTVFGTPLCNLANCGTSGGAAAPFAGSNWAWFGGTESPESSFAGQNVALPALPFLFLRFQLRVGEVASPFTDTLTVRVDATPVATFVEPALAEAAYSERYVNVTAFANGSAHAVSFNYAHPDGTRASFTVDNVELVSCTTPVELFDFKIQ